MFLEKLQEKKFQTNMTRLKNNKSKITIITKIYLMMYAQIVKMRIIVIKTRGFNQI